MPRIFGSLKKPGNNLKLISKGLEIFKKRNGEEFIKAYVIFREKFIWWSNTKYYVAEFNNNVIFLVSYDDSLSYIINPKKFKSVQEALEDLEIAIKKEFDRIKKEFDNEVVEISKITLK